MKLSFWTLGMPAWSNTKFADKAAELGYGGIDLRCTRNGNLSVDSTPEELEELQQDYAAKGIEIASLLGYTERGNGKDPINWDAVEADLVAHAKLAQRMGDLPFRITVGYTDPETSWDTYLDNLSKATKTARSEVPTSHFMYQNHAGSATATQLGALIERMADPRVGFGFSPDHCFAEHEDALALADRYGPIIQQYHVADRQKNADGTYEACWIGDGVVPHRAILETLAKHGFDGWMSLKWEASAESANPQGEKILEFYPGYMKGLEAQPTRA